MVAPPKGISEASGVANAGVAPGKATSVRENRAVRPKKEGLSGSPEIRDAPTAVRFLGYDQLPAANPLAPSSWST